MKPVAFVGAAFSVGGASIGSRRSPAFYRDHHPEKKGRFVWRGIVWQDTTIRQRYPKSLPSIRRSCRQLAHKVRRLRQGYLPVVIGGDHSCAIGTWSGMAVANKPAMGLLWIDAHFDSHTPSTSQSLNVHGMPLAVLLGEGDSRLMLQTEPVLDPDYTVVFGVRSYETGEPELLQQLGVRYYKMEEIRQRGLRVCLEEAWRKVSDCPGGFGVSLDLDAIDPMYAPAVSVGEPHGLSLPVLINALKAQKKQGLQAVELVEFNPYLEHSRRTVNALTTLITSLTTRR